MMDFLSSLTPLETVALVSAWGSGSLIAWILYDSFRRAREARELVGSEIIVTETQSAVVKALLPLARRIGMGVRAAFDPNADKAGDEAPGFYRTLHRRADGRLASAGHPEGINADEYVGFIVLCTLAGGLAGVLVFMMARPMGMMPLFTIGAALGASYMPSWLKKKRTIRHTRILRELPFALDLLTLAMEAGLDFSSALDRICRKLGTSPLGEEFQFMLREIRFGKPRSEAMRDMGRRIAMGEVQSVVSSLVQAEEMGSNIGPVLRIQADQQRERRSQRAEETAGKMPVKLLLPLVMLLGVTLEIIFGPIIISMVE